MVDAKRLRKNSKDALFFLSFFTISETCISVMLLLSPILANPFIRGGSRIFSKEGGFSKKIRNFCRPSFFFRSTELIFRGLPKTA